jgi:hypothetical protein
MPAEYSNAERKGAPMSGGFRHIVDQVVEELAAEARSNEMEVDPSMAIELLNYSRHEGVYSLDEGDLRLVLRGIGQRALKHSQPAPELGKSRVGAGAVRHVISELCHDPFSACSRAARVLIDAARAEK